MSGVDYYYYPNVHAHSIDKKLLAYVSLLHYLLFFVYTSTLFCCVKRCLLIISAYHLYVCIELHKFIHRGVPSRCVDY